MITEEYRKHLEDQLPFLYEETRKRLVYDPFRDSTAVLLVEDPVSLTPREQLMAHLLHQAGRDSYSLGTLAGLRVLKSFDAAATIIDSRIVEDGHKVHIRGADYDAEHTPLYLDCGLYDYQWVYPIFDWSAVQVEVAIQQLEFK